MRHVCSCGCHPEQDPQGEKSKLILFCHCTALSKALALRDHLTSDRFFRALDDAVSKDSQVWHLERIFEKFHILDPILFKRELNYYYK